MPPDGPTVAERLTEWLNVALCGAPAPTFDGDHIVFLSDESGMPEVWSVPTTGGAARRLMSGAERVGTIHPSPTGPSAVVAVDAGGNEHWQLRSIPDLGRVGAPTRSLTEVPEVIHSPGGWRRDGRHFVFASNARDRRFFDVHELDVEAPGSVRSLHQHDGTAEVMAVDGEEVVIAHRNTNLDVDLFLQREGAAVALNPHSGEVTVTSATLAGSAVYAGSNPGRELCGLVRFRRGGSGHEFLRVYEGDVEAVEASPDGARLAVVVNRDGWSDTRVYEIATGEERALNSGPRGIVGSLRWLPDSSGFVYAVSSNDGVEVFRRNVATGKEKRLASSPRPVPRHLAAPRLGQMRASDGLGVPFWEYAPAEGRVKGCLLWIHGGPEGQARPGFAPTLEFLVAEGWRVVAPNIRGSTGYGRTFVHLDDVERRLDSVRDVAELAERLIRDGKAARGRIGIIGGSYGGFVVLSAASRYPDLWGAAVDLVGISNFVTFLRETGPWRRALREAEYGSLEKDQALLEEISPIHRAGEIRAPLLVIHGRNDPRVPVHEAEQLVASMRERGRTVELLVFDDEGHGIVRRPNRIQAWSRAVEFFESHLAA